MGIEWQFGTDKEEGTLWSDGLESVRNVGKPDIAAETVVSGVRGSSCAGTGQTSVPTCWST